MTKRVVCLLAAVLLLCAGMPCEAVGTSAASAVLMEAGSGRILYEYNAGAQMRIASTTKILTALVAVEEGNLSDTVTVSRKAAFTEGSSMYLKEGEQLSLESLLYGLLLSSGNDAAVAIAEHVGGSEERFVQMMNDRARSLGMERSSFSNPNGLDAPEHYSTALDMARLACAAMENPTLRRIASTRSAAAAGRTMTNHNKLLSRVPGCVGLKTGYTRAAGRTLVSCAERDGERLIAVTLQDGNDWADHEALLEYGFEHFPLRRILRKGERFNIGGLTLAAAEDFRYPLAEGEQPELSVERASLVLPASAQTPAGRVIMRLAGNEIGQVELMTEVSVPPSAALSSLHSKAVREPIPPESPSVSYHHSFLSPS